MTETPRSLDRRDWFMLLSFFAAVALVSLFGARFSPSVDPVWYEQLRKPSWNPPRLAFPIVWTTLYAMIAVSGWLIWRAGRMSAEAREEMRPALVAWVIQLGLNAAWTPIFFGLHAIGWALLEMLVLLGAILATAVLAQRRSKAAALLLIPYIAWTGFATALTTSIWLLNR